MLTDWMMNSLWIFVLAAVLFYWFYFSRRRRGRRRTEARARGQRGGLVQTVGFIRSAERTGFYVNDNPQFRFQIDAIGEDGTLFPTYVKKILPLFDLAGMTAGAAVPIRYDPRDLSKAVWDEEPDPRIAAERTALYQCRRHPDDLSYEERMALLQRGVVRKARLEQFRLTGRQEAGDWEAEAVIRLVGPDGESAPLRRTLYVADRALEHLVPGRYVDVRIVPGDGALFGFLFRSTELFGARRDGGAQPG